jgi:hypothetical protein
MTLLIVANNVAPFITLNADPLVVRRGRATVLTAATSDPDGDPVTVFWFTTGGALSSGVGSQVVFTYLDRALLDGTRSFRGGRLQRAMIRRGAEPFTFGIDPRELRSYLAERSFGLLDDAAGEELDRRYFRPHGRRDRSNDYQRVALARVAGASPQDRPGG